MQARGTRCSGSTPPPWRSERPGRRLQKEDFQAQFFVGNALELSALNRTFDTVIDSGLFHTLSDEDRPALAESLAAVLAPGGRYFMLCFNEQNPGEYPLPRRITQDEIRDAFRDGWVINYIRPAVFENSIQADGHHAWLASISRPMQG